MGVRKLRGTFLRVRYSFLRLIAASKDVLETYQAVGYQAGDHTLTCSTWRRAQTSLTCKIHHVLGEL